MFKRGTPLAGPIPRPMLAKGASRAPPPTAPTARASQSEEDLHPVRHPEKPEHADARATEKTGEEKIPTRPVRPRREKYRSGTATSAPAPGPAPPALSPPAPPPLNLYALYKAVVTKRGGWAHVASTEAWEEIAEEVGVEGGMGRRLRALYRDIMNPFEEWQATRRKAVTPAQSIASPESGAGGSEKWEGGVQGGREAGVEGGREGEGQVSSPPPGKLEGGV
ncbi:ARID/BRIGHT DNA-binding domain protein, partial [Nannochloropsis gaditana]